MKDIEPASQGEDNSVREDGTVRNLETLAEECPRVFQSVMSRSWMQAELSNLAWARWAVVNKILQIARVDEESALDVLELPFLETLEHLDGFTMEFLRDLFKAAPDEAMRLISAPEALQRDRSELPTDFQLLYLRSEGPAVSEGLDSLQWLNDGLDPYWDQWSVSPPPGYHYESEVLSIITSLYLKSPPAFLALVERPWLQGSIDTNLKYSAAINVLDFAYDSPEATAQIAAMEFLDTLEEDDLGIMQQLLDLKWEDRGRFMGILSDPSKLRDHFNSSR